MENKFSHIDNHGKANMVDVGHKPQQLRIAKASGFIYMHNNTIELLKQNLLKKGDALTVAEIAGIQAAKQTHLLIPLCHNLNITKVDLKCALNENGVQVNSEVHCVGQTGVEMEALTAVSVALLTIYDMCKAVDKNMKIDNIILVEKHKNDI